MLAREERERGGSKRSVSIFAIMILTPKTLTRILDRELFTYVGLESDTVSWLH